VGEPTPSGLRPSPPPRGGDLTANWRLAYSWDGTRLEVSVWSPPRGGGDGRSPEGVGSPTNKGLSAVLLEIMSDFHQLFLSLETRTPELLATGPSNPDLSREIETATLFGAKGGAMVECCRAGLLLWNDDLEGAHPLIQELPDETSAFWHAILHRREGDYTNARYWWNRTGGHPAFEAIYDSVLHRVPEFSLLDELRAEGRWLPLAFTDACELAARNGKHDAELRATQRLEIRGLLEWCASRVRAMASG